MPASQIRRAFSSIVVNTGLSSPGELEITPSTSEVAVCCSSASARCSRASWSSRLYFSSCCSRSAGGLRTSPMRVFAFVPVERSLRPRVGLFAPLRDKGHLVGTVTGPLPVGPSQGSSLSILREPHAELAPFHTRSPRRRYSRNETLWNASLSLLRLDPCELHHLAPLL